MVANGRGFSMRYAVENLPSFVIIGKQGKVEAAIDKVFLNDRFNELKDAVLAALK